MHVFTDVVVVVFAELSAFVSFNNDLRFPPKSNDALSEDETNFATSGVLDRQRHAATNELGWLGIPKSDPHTMPQSTTVTIMNVLP